MEDEYILAENIDDNKGFRIRYRKSGGPTNPNCIVVVQVFTSDEDPPSELFLTPKDSMLLSSLLSWAFARIIEGMPDILVKDILNSKAKKAILNSRRKG